MYFGTKVKGYVRVNIKDRITRRCPGWPNSKTIGTACVFPEHFFVNSYRYIVAGVKIFDVVFCDVSGTDRPDTSVCPQQRIPGLKAVQQQRLYAGMFIKKIIGAIRKSIKQFF